MKSINLSIALFLFVLFSASGLFGQSNMQTNSPDALKNQSQVTVIDENPALTDQTITPVNQDGSINAYVLDDNGNLVKTTVTSIGKRTLIKKADFDALPIEKQKFILTDEEGFIIVE